MADPLDWNAIDEVGGDGRLLEYLIAHVPRARWGERDNDGHGLTLLHAACCGTNEAALILLLQQPGGFNDTSACLVNRTTPAHSAAARGLSRMLELLCVVGADLRALGQGSAPLTLSQCLCIRLCR